jgi:hypothetical protein
MLPLDDLAAWKRLTTVNGDGTEIVRLLQEWEQDAKGNADERLYHSLVHQWDSCDAAYAALPHIVHIAQASNDRYVYGVFALIAGIEIARQMHGEQVPLEFLADYFAALRQVPALIEKYNAVAWEESDARAVAAALIASKGEWQLARFIFELEADTREQIEKMGLL